MRKLIAFACEGETLVGTLDAAPGETGLLIVSGGNEIRMGPHRGMALLAQRLATEGVSVLRFDRRGIGDSTGENRGHLSAAPDIAAAARAFREHAPRLRTIVGFGNCDAATALALFGRDAGIDRLVLANPWVVEESDDLPPAAAIRARYAKRLRDPGAWGRMLRGQVDFGKVFRGLGKLRKSASQPSNPLADRFFAAMPANAHIVLATGDATAIAYADAASTRGWSGPVTRIDTASHSFARAADKEALYRAIVESLR